MRDKLKVYFASPLFTDMERDYNKKAVDFLRNKMKDSLDIYLPQENDAINDKSGYADSQMIAIADTKELLESDLLIAVLDGSTIDVGVASEIGIAYQAGIDIIGIYTDSRQGTFGNVKKVIALDKLAESQFSYINLYTVGLIKSSFKVHKKVNKNDGIVNNLDDLSKLVDYFVKLKESYKNHNSSYYSIYSDGFIFNVERKMYESDENVMDRFSKEYKLKVGSDMVLLCKYTDTNKPYLEQNFYYRDYLTRPSEYHVRKVQKQVEPSPPFIVTGYHYTYDGTKMLINTDKQFNFYATEQLSRKIIPGGTVLVDTVHGSKRLLVTEIKPSKDVKFKPTKSVIEVL